MFREIFLCMFMGLGDKQKPDLKRLREIISVLVKYHFGNVLETIKHKKKFSNLNFPKTMMEHLMTQHPKGCV